MSISVGIDFGTSTTLIAVRKDGFLPDVISIGEVTPWMPSVVGIDESGDLVIGEPAELVSEPFRSVKSSITNDEDERAKNFGLSPKELIERVLREAMNRALAARSEISEAVDYFVGCPAGWDGSQRRAIADVASSLGIDVDIAEVIDEPVAAGLSWVESKWFSREAKPLGRVLVFDAGGGTLDVAVMNVEESEGGSNRIVVLSAGSLAESGDAVDLSIARHIAKANGIDGHKCEKDVSLLKDARDIKEALANASEVTNNDILIGRTKCSITINQDDLNAIISQQLERSIKLVDNQLRYAELRGDEGVKPFDLGKLASSDLCQKIENVVLVGGLTKLPQFGAALRELFTSAAIHEVSNPQELVSLGLTFGDRLQSLNLPRPPVNLMVESDGERHIIYPAFEPLFKGIDPNYNTLIRVELLPGFVERGTPIFYCQSPTRDRRRLQMVVAVKHDDGASISNWWREFEGSDWREIPQEELPSSLDFVAEMDERSKDVVYDEPNFVDATTYLTSIRNLEGFKTSVFVGSAIYLPEADSSGAVIMDVDGSVKIKTRSGGHSKQKELELKILFWPLKSDELVEREKRRFRPEIRDEVIEIISPEDEVQVVPTGSDELFDDSTTLIGAIDDTSLPEIREVVETGESSSCVESFQAELERIATMYAGLPRNGFLAANHLAISTIMADYDMTDEDIMDEILDVADQDQLEVFFVTEDDVPKIVLFRFVEDSLTKKKQNDLLTEMTYEMGLLRDRTTVRGLKNATARARYDAIKRVRRLDPEFHFHLVVLKGENNELLDTDVVEFDGIRSGLDQVAVHSLTTLLNLFCAEETPRESMATFAVDADKYFTFDGTSGKRLAQLLLSAEEYVKGTYPIGVDLFRLNPRLFLSKAAGPNKGMKQTLDGEESEYFHLLNNGITGVCESLSVSESGGKVQITATNLQIVNGCQTTETIWAWARRAADRSKVMVPLRLVQAGDDETLARRISMTTNSQSAIAAADLVANDEIQQRAKKALNEFNVFYESRRGEWRKLSMPERNRLKQHDFDWASGDILKINLRELGQALLSVSGRPNQAKEQIAGLFKQQNRSMYREVFSDSWEDSSQIAFVAMLYIFIRDIDNWVPATASKEFRTLAGLGRFYVMYLLYEYWRKGDDAFFGTASERAEDQELLVNGDYSKDWIDDFDPSEIAPLANLVIKALDGVLKSSNGAIDGYRALLRQGAHKAAIEDRFRLLLDAQI